jgi:phosphoribosylformylglycinamidine (FGAM) synthase PurS component
MDQQTEIPGYYKTPEGAIINKDVTGLNAYKMRRVREMKMDAIEDEIRDLKNDMQEIKELLRGLVK